MSDQGFIIAYPDTLIVHQTIDAARKAADIIRSENSVKIYKIELLEHWGPHRARPRKGA